MAIQTTGITTSLVAATIGQASSDIGTLCSSSKINKWSKHKPVIQPIGNNAGVDWWKDVEGKCGLNLIEYVNIYDVIDAIDSVSGATWQYNKPSGGSSSPYCLGHFKGYEHSSVVPFKVYTPTGTIYTASAGAQLSVTINTPIVIPEGNLYLTDIDTINDCYLCVILKKDSQIKYVTSNITLWDGSPNVNVPVYGLPNGTYTLYVCLATNMKTDINDNNTVNTFYTLDEVTKKNVVLEQNPLNILIDGRWENDDPISGIVDCRLVITNNASTSIAMQNCYLSLRHSNNTFTDPFELGERSTYLNVITIAGGSSVTIDESFMADVNDSPTGQWKIWFSSTSPYSIQKSASMLTPMVNP